MTKESEPKGSLTRRDFLKFSGLAAAGAAAGGCAGAGTSARARGGASPGSAVLTRKAELPEAGGRRVVVVGGGWSGLTIAKYLRKNHSGLDVVLVERREIFMSCPISNLWLADLVDLEFLTHSYVDAARNNGYLFFNAMVVDVDRDARRVFTNLGYVDYDYVILAPGIDYNYASIGVEDPESIHALKTHYPAAFIPGSEHLSLKNKLADFEGGEFVLTVPSGNYRCLPGPYERACMVASVLKREKIPGKVVLLDANPDITIKADGFHAAFDELYKGYLDYRPSTRITGVDVAGRRVQTEFEEIPFRDAAIYPSIRASTLVETLGLVNPQSLQMEADIDPFFYNIKGDERVYVAGDARPMPYSKSGNTANSEGKFVAHVVASRADGKDPGEWRSPQTICYSMVNADPKEAIMVDAHYAYNREKKAFGFHDVKLDQERNTAKGFATLEWARGLYRDMFS
ncbi:MAG: NAD(P)/FAD-dependent oxidoreductase [Gammaproteobacteria bacterium]|nr:NAD(P)/FAD-dependent oxidoreductase [Gammaproteobacteria bacterium]NIR99042.1 NAD(P)/FAD-dependent oxidoreductase [Gammaproteobacteria bacterium]NIT64665.1 NAD(P)/FAD-dependent oxidoreductase [Gammaproteobacteria bacterium]NIY33245.1 FAD-dependent oxidoreductase [Gammaproteobacteria bacterium]